MVVDKLFVLVLVAVMPVGDGVGVWYGSDGGEGSEL